MHQKGRLLLLLILPDGSKSLIPADWTDLAPTTQPHVVVTSDQTATLGSQESLFHARAVVDALLGRLARLVSERADPTVTKEGVLAAKSETLRPLKEIYVWETLENEPRSLAIEILARLIVRAAADNHTEEENHE